MTDSRCHSLARVARIAALSTALACVSAIASAQDRSTLALDPRAPRGASGSIEISSPGVALRAKPSSDITAPILVRVKALENDRYRVEYLGLVSGHYDLAPYIEQTDGRAATALGSLEVDVFTQLPPNAPSDVFGLDAPSFGFAAYYRVILATLALVWVGIPVALLVRRVLRRAPVVPLVIEPKAPTTADLLFAAVDAARATDAQTELSIDERGRLELRLLQILRGSSQHASLAQAVQELRTDARTANVVRAVERWLHASDTHERTAALDAIDQLRASALASSHASPPAFSPASPVASPSASVTR